MWLLDCVWKWSDHIMLTLSDSVSHSKYCNAEWMQNDYTDTISRTKVGLYIFSVLM